MNENWISIQLNFNSIDAKATCQVQGTDRWDTYCDSCVWLTNESALNSSSSARDSSTGLSGQTLKLLTACNTLQQPKKVNDQCKTINKTENGTCGNSTKRLLHKRRAKNSNGAPKKKKNRKKKWGENVKVGNYKAERTVTLRPEMEMFFCERNKNSKKLWEREVKTTDHEHNWSIKGSV